MSTRQNVIPFLLASLLTAVPLAVLLGLVFWPERPAPPVERPRVPAWLHELCDVEVNKQPPWAEIIIHHSGTEQGNLEIFDRYHRNHRHWESAGYHFVIGNGSRSGDGEIEVGPRWRKQEIGAHCTRHNHIAIGICLVGNFELDDHKPTQAQMLSLAQLTAYLSLCYDIPLSNIYGHGQVPGADTDCPGKNFPFKGYLLLVKAIRDQYRPRD